MRKHQTTPLLLEVHSTPPHESRDPNQPIANFRCTSVAQFSGSPPLKSLSVIKSYKNFIAPSPFIKASISYELPLLAIEYLSLNIPIIKNLELRITDSLTKITGVISSSVNFLGRRCRGNRKVGRYVSGCGVKIEIKMKSETLLNTANTIFASSNGESLLLWKRIDTYRKSQLNSERGIMFKESLNVTGVRSEKEKSNHAVDILRFSIHSHKQGIFGRSIYRGNVRSMYVNVDEKITEVTQAIKFLTTTNESSEGCKKGEAAKFGVAASGARSFPAALVANSSKRYQPAAACFAYYQNGDSNS
ncbi:hypothetical protein WN51_11373 [Melipona quadrifasciata]|uniref:Uncharacterized protein n=1 Tax=Melipona quadrifasciata TaxID=166423 RepID=A0A0M9ABB4_9HYME|nr:hypothetical protein WN51_11373 [Melipona quadrifasciata]